ncbi:hypothetical protein AVEN_250071-1 [Araneus ventricosus]|uniref:Uncharacterized protein n=1 Tax=Araneus ventricosus TaxID=182803 RepID=A0A4Y2U0N8_ARAVE|nr:hypothetical protein AVEN_250071-1 [Araneus ventricosus]
MEIENVMKDLDAENYDDSDSNCEDELEKEASINDVTLGGGQRMCSVVSLAVCGLALSSKKKTRRSLLHSRSLAISGRSFGTHLHLFPALKSALSGRHFRSNEEVRLAVKNFLRGFYQGRRGPLVASRLPTTHTRVSWFFSLVLFQCT